MLIAEGARGVAGVLQRRIGALDEVVDLGDGALAGFNVRVALKLILAVGEEGGTQVFELLRRQEVDQHGDIHSRRSGSAHEIWPTKEAMQTGADITRYI